VSTAGERPTIAVIDYGMGNRRSVEKALTHVGADAQVSSDFAVLRAADGLVLPGVGAFARGMAHLRSSGLDALIYERVATGTPLLGICLGMQLLFESSTELGGDTGLGLVPGVVREIDAGTLRVPHIGWNEVRLERESRLLSAGAPFYHVHSFCAHAAFDADVVGTTEYGERFVTVVERGSVYGVQFHPEKSSLDGLALLARFTELALSRSDSVRSAA
jgi:imidazole glycerol-phosphate synthase subunit HisH